MTEGEFDLIRRLFAADAVRAKVEADAGLRLGVGDDASLHHVADGMELVVSVDAAVEGVHWPVDLPLEVAADKAVCAALSDLAAMGARPRWAWLAVMTRDRAGLEAMAHGAKAALRRHDTTLAGGDVSRSSLHALTVTVAGETPAGSAMRRSAARPGQGLWLAGRVGFHALGLRQWLAGERRGDFIPDFLRIEPAIGAGWRLCEAGVRCCIDVSDGLGQDAAHLARDSGVRLEIDVECLPDWALLCERVGEEAALDAALAGGEDYALLFTADERLELPAGLACQIGRVREGAGEVVMRLHGRIIEHQRQGYDHFA